MGSKGKTWSFPQSRWKTSGEVPRCWLVQIASFLLIQQVFRKRIFSCATNIIYVQPPPKFVSQFETLILFLINCLIYSGSRPHHSWTTLLKISGCLHWAELSSLSRSNSSSNLTKSFWIEKIFRTSHWFSR